MLTRALVAAGASGTGTLVAAAAEVVEKTDPSTVAPWVQGVGSGAAVAGLVYVARLIIKGDLVSRPVAERENETNAAIAAAAQRESQLQALLAESYAREQTLANVASDSARTLGEATEQMRWWRDRRDREGRGRDHA